MNRTPSTVAPRSRPGGGAGSNAAMPAATAPGADAERERRRRGGGGVGAERRRVAVDRTRVARRRRSRHELARRRTRSRRRAGSPSRNQRTAHGAADETAAARRVVAVADVRVAGALAREDRAPSPPRRRRRAVPVEVVGREVQQHRDARVEARRANRSWKEEASTTSASCPRARPSGTGGRCCRTRRRRCPPARRHGGEHAGRRGLAVRARSRPGTARRPAARRAPARPTRQAARRGPTPRTRRVGGTPGLVDDERRAVEVLRIVAAGRAPRSPRSRELRADREPVARAATRSRGRSAPSARAGPRAAAEPAHARARRRPRARPRTAPLIPSPPRAMKSA